MSSSVTTDAALDPVAAPSDTVRVRYRSSARASRLALVGCVFASFVLASCSEDSNALSIGLVLTDPRDGRHLIVNVGPCSDGGVATAEERANEVVIKVTGNEIEPPCASEQLDVRLDAPLGGRTIV